MLHLLASTLRHTLQKKAEKQNSENDQHSVLQQTHSRKDPSLRCGTLSRRRQKSKIPKMGCIPCFNRNTAAKTLCCAAAAKKEEEEEEEEEEEKKFPNSIYHNSRSTRLCGCYWYHDFFTHSAVLHLFFCGLLGRLLFCRPAVLLC